MAPGKRVEGFRSFGVRVLHAGGDGYVLYRNENSIPIAFEGLKGAKEASPVSVRGEEHSCWLGGFYYKASVKAQWVLRRVPWQIQEMRQPSGRALRPVHCFPAQGTGRSWEWHRKALQAHIFHEPSFVPPMLGKRAKPSQPLHQN